MKTSDRWLLLYITGPGCEVCKVLEPKVRQMVADEFPEAGYRLVDAAEEPEVAASYGVFSVPAVILLFGTREYLREVRNISLVNLKERIRRLRELSMEEPG